MKMIMNNAVEEKNISIMEHVRLKILADFFRGDVLGQAARVKDEKSKIATQIIADKISGDDLKKEDDRRKAK